VLKVVDNAQINVLAIDAHTCSNFCILMPPNLNAHPITFFWSYEFSLLLSHFNNSFLLRILMCYLVNFVIVWGTIVLELANLDISSR
jgi:hypothetical protein